jgi:hypothetical protein
LYAFQTGGGNEILGAQPTGSDFNPGSLVLRVQNNTVATINALQISYDVWQRNDQARTSSLNFSHSADDVSYTSVASLDFSTDGALDALGWRSVARNATISGLSIPVGGFYYLRWTSADVNTGASGSRDELGIDNVSVTEVAVSNNPPTISIPDFPTSGVSGVSGVMTDPTTPTFQIPFTVNDIETPLANLTVAITNNSSPARLPSAVITTVNAAAGQYRLDLGQPGNTTEGYANLTITVTDAGVPPANTSFVFKYGASRGDGLTDFDRYHTGTSDASTTTAIDADFMLVADDEDQTIRVYDRDTTGAAVVAFDFTANLGLTDLSGGLPREVDIEGSTRNGNRIYWMGSHSNSSSGSNRPNRRRIFATDLSGTGAATTLTYVGRYDALRDDLLAWDSGNGHGLGANYFGLTASAATGVIPESAALDGFNVEGLSFAPSSGTTAYIGFRAPLVPEATAVGIGTRTHALVIPITNFDALVSGNPSTGPATFGAPIRLNLGGKGVRSLTCNSNGCLIVAGSADAMGQFSLYTWTGNPADAPVQRSGSLINLNPESIADIPAGAITDTTVVQLVSDNGDTIWYNDGIISKDLPEVRHQKFRSDLVTVGAPGEPDVLRIHDIQQARHTSTLDGQNVSVTGIVTDTRSNGYYLQEPDATIDTDVATSEAILVFTGSAPTVAVGDLVRVTGTVDEFRPDTDNLTITEIVGPTSQVLSSGNALPSPIVLGNAAACGTVNRIPPNAVINNDGAGNVENQPPATFDPTTDGIDFWESLEGMRVCVNNARVVAPSNRFREFYVVADNGVNAAGFNSRGGITVSAGDFNPERIQIDDDSFAPLTGFPTTLTTGATVTTPIVGVVHYSFDNYEVLATQAFTVDTSTSAVPQIADNIAVGAAEVTIASYNVENLPGNAATAQFNARAAQIVTNLRSPDFVLVQEMQDNDGTGTTTTDATTTFNNLVTAIQTAGGPLYNYTQINPGPGNTDGGQVNGNIRVGILFRADRGITLATAPAGDFDDPNSVNCVSSSPSLALNPGRIDPTNTAFNSSRKPLATQFVMNGRTIFIINNHFNSKGGDGILYGFVQPPVLTSEVQRVQQATVVRNFVNTILACDPNAYVVVGGDLNDFQFSTPLQIVAATSPQPMTILNTTVTNPADRYGYIFEGNSQALDHILVSRAFMNTTNVRYQSVHINAEYCEKTVTGCTQQVSDHDPSLAWFRFVTAGDSIGVKRVSNGLIDLRATLTPGPADYTLVYGFPTDIALAGDWNGDGLDTLGFYRPSTAFFTLSDQKAEDVAGIPTTTYNFGYGSLNDRPVVGDWDGNGSDSVGVYRASNRYFFLRNTLNGGFANVSIFVPFAQAGDIAIAGDWNGDGRATPGIYRPSTAQFFLSNRFLTGTATLDYTFAIGDTFSEPVVGDWNGDGADGIGVFKNGQFFLRNSLVGGTADFDILFGATNDKPLAGRWVAPSGGSAPVTLEVAPAFEPQR